MNSHYKFIVLQVNIINILVKIGTLYWKFEHKLNIPIKSDSILDSSQS